MAASGGAPMKSDVPPLKYLLECSEISLKSFRLAQLTNAADASKDLRRVLDDWIEARALVLLAQWFEQYGAELVALAGAPAAELGSTAPLQEISDQLPLRYE